MLIKNGIYIATDRVEIVSEDEILLINNEMAKFSDEIDWNINTEKKNEYIICIVQNLSVIQCSCTRCVLKDFEMYKNVYFGYDKFIICS